MTIRLVDKRWDKEITEAASADVSHLMIICPFIKAVTIERLLSKRMRSIKVITRFKLSDYAEGVSDIEALRKLLRANACIRGVKNLHAKLYVFGARRAILTSANLTEAALTRNHEFGMVTEDSSNIADCRSYFDDLWGRAGRDLTEQELKDWIKRIEKHQHSGGRSNRAGNLGDFGTDIGIPEPPLAMIPAFASTGSQAFVKFLGLATDRLPLSTPTFEEIKRAGCHRCLSYPANKRPKSVRDGAVMFIARLTKDPADIRVFGRATGMRHVKGRDDATQEDKALRPFMSKWPRYIRVHNAEFVAGTLTNGVSLSDLMNTLGANSFASTQRNATRRKGNTNPRAAYSQKASVELSDQGTEWLNERLQVAFETHGKLPQDVLDKLDWPTSVTMLKPGSAA